MYRYLERRLVEHLLEFLRRTYDLEITNIVVEQPPKIELGEYALPLAFELARKLDILRAKLRKRSWPASVRFRASTNSR